ncbi:putative lipoprotein [Hyphomonas neptunium ATCC 15444]|uniref:Putative lipoprotein n=2 Tax=Hyphomonas TaxID=85 RepID=Q0C296_HYPNA|nr:MULTISPECIES: DUF3558 family protein [Hyphomonas]ABI76657.1 putative lipoprotein [Hyphomonas neptunium ATCC 15444]KCZ93141.1 putative lipoprotein [Hyphomonas hirschiana VP5]
MKALKILPLLALLAAATACGGSEPAAPVEAPLTPEAAPAAAEPGEPAAPVTAATTGFDWNKWAAIVNENPCNWLPAEDLADLGITGTGVLETTPTQTRCLWKDSDGGQLFSAGIQTWDSAANLAAERQSQTRLAADMDGFNRVGEGAGTVTAIYRSSRGNLVIFPNSDDETAAIVLSAQKTMRDDEVAKTVKDERASAFAGKLISSYGL